MITFPHFPRSNCHKFWLSLLLFDKPASLGKSTHLTTSTWGADINHTRCQVQPAEFSWSKHPKSMEHKTNHFHPFPTGKASSSPALALWNRFNITGSAGRNWFRAIFQEQFLGQVGYRVGTRSSWLRQWQIPFYGKILLGLVARGSSKRMDTIRHDWQQKSRKNLKQFSIAMLNYQRVNENN